MAASLTWHFRLRLSEGKDCETCTPMAPSPKGFTWTIRLALPSALIVTAPLSVWIPLSGSAQIYQGSVFPGFMVDHVVYPIILRWLTQIGSIPSVSYAEFMPFQTVVAHGLVLAATLWIFVGSICLVPMAKIAKTATRGAVVYSSYFYLSRFPILILFLFIAALLLIFCSAYDHLLLTQQSQSIVTAVGAILVVGSSVFSAVLSWIVALWSVFLTFWLSSQGQ